ncbi:MAG: BTAD domain-containing putative transcriptional regulator [Thermodesulfobacteriota bacterium]
MNQKIFSISKITRPNLTGVLRRRRLFKLLDDRRRRPVTWVSAPAGSGKTTLVSSYLDARKLTEIWYHVDEGDGELSTFFHYMGLAARKAAPRRKRPLPHLTPEYMLGLPTFARRYFEELYARLRPPFCIVFDNFQNVPDNSPLHELLALALSGVPEGGRVMVISRSGPPPQYSRLRANGLMTVIGGDELVLTEDESRGIVRLRGGGIDESTVSALHERSGGWAAGLVLFVERALIDGPDSIGRSGLSREELFDYFTGEVFDKTDIETQDLLLNTALLPTMTPRMAEKLTGSPSAARKLSRLAAKNYFTIRRPGREPAYQYHDLFREFLLSRVEENFTPKRIDAMKRLAGRVLDEAGYMEDAAALYSEVGEWDRLAALVMRHARELLAQGRNMELEGWIRRFPEKVLENAPWLLYWRAVCRAAYSPSESLGIFDAAFRLFRAARDPAGIYLAWSGAVDSIFYENEDVRKFDRWTRLFERLTREFPIPGEEIETSIACSMMLLLSAGKLKFKDIESWLERASVLFEKCRDAALKMQLGFQLAVACDHVGDQVRGDLILHAAGDLARSVEAPPLAFLKWKVVESGYMIRKGLSGESIRAAREGLEKAAETGIYLMNLQLLGYGAGAALCTGDTGTAEGFLKEMAPVLDRVGKFDTSLYNFLRSWQAILLGDTPRAIQYIKTSLKITEELGFLYPLAFSNYGMAEVLYERGERKKAQAHLARFRSFGRRLRSGIFEYIYLLAKARGAFDAGREGEGQRLLTKAFSIAGENGYVNFMYMRPSVMAGLCARAIEAGIEVEYVSGLVRMCGFVPESPPLDVEEWPWPVKVYTLGRFSILRDGTPLKFARKSQQKPVELLKALIALGGRRVSEEQLCDVLWPEADGDTAHQALSTTLFRLRQLLGVEGAVERSEGRLSLNPRYCWVDTWSFERMLGQAEGLCGGANNMKASRLIEKASGLYHGLFLAGDVDKTWSMSLRERLKSKFLRHTEWLGQYLEKLGKPGRAVECYKKGIEVDPLAEEFYQRLMLCYKRLGRRAEAEAVYRRLKEVLSRLLEVEPSVKTESIRRMLRT